MFKKTFRCLVVGWMVAMPAMVFAWSAPEMHCAGPAPCFCPNGSRPMADCNESCESLCGLGGSSGDSGSYDNGEALREQQRLEAERRAESERQAELERQRKAADERHQKEEVERQAKFIQDRDDAAGSLRGSKGTSSTVSGSVQLRGSNTLRVESGLKDALNDTGLRGTQPANNAAKNQQTKAWQQVHCAANIAKYALEALQTKADYDEFGTLSVEAFKAMDGQRPNVGCGTAPAFPEMGGKAVDMDRVIASERQVLERATAIAERMKQRGDKPGTMQPTASKPPANETQIEKVRRETRELSVINSTKITGKTQQEINQQEQDRKELAKLVIKNNELESGKLVDRSYRGLDDVYVPSPTSNNKRNAK